MEIQFDIKECEPVMIEDKLYWRVAVLATDSISGRERYVIKLWPINRPLWSRILSRKIAIIKAKRKAISELKGGK